MDCCPGPRSGEVNQAIYAWAYDTIFHQDPVYVRVGVTRNSVV